MSVPTAIIWSGDGFGLRDLRLIERPHVHVALGGPCRAGDVAQPRGSQVEAGLAIRERAGTEFAVGFPSWSARVGCWSRSLPMDVGEGVVSQGLGHVATTNSAAVFILAAADFNDRSPSR